MSVETDEPTEQQARARRGPAFYIGLALVLTGVGLLGYVGWQFYGTNIVAHHTQQRVLAGLRQDWRGSTGQGGTASEAGRGKASALVRIPRFGDDYVVPVLEGVGDEQLASGFGHFPDAATAGRRGNYALAAHRVTHGEPLRDMPKLRPGDEVVVETRDAVYTYQLDTDPNDLIVTFEDIWVIDPVPDNPRGGVQPPSQRPAQKLITLTTCAELFHTDNRMVAFGHLVDTARKRPQ